MDKSGKRIGDHTDKAHADLTAQDFGLVVKSSLPRCEVMIPINTLKMTASFSLASACPDLMEEKSCRKSSWSAGLQVGLDSTLHEMPANELPVDLIGPLPNLGDLGVAHQSFGAEILDIPVSSMQLHALGRDAHSHVRGPQL